MVCLFNQSLNSNKAPAAQAINDILQPFAPNFKFIGTSCPTLDPDLEVTNYVFSSGDINILTFTVRINTDTKSIEFRIDSTGQRYIATDLNDKVKIRDFVSHLMVLEAELLKIYKVLTNKLKAIPSSDSITTYYLFDIETKNAGTIKIKNSLIIFEYNHLTKYTYTSIKRLLANPLIKKFKKPKFWFWT